MMKFFAGCYEAVCVISSILNFIIYGACGGFFGHYLATNILKDIPNTTFYTLLLGLTGIIIGFFVNVLTFGLIAQIIEIRKSLEELKKNK